MMSRRLIIRGFGIYFRLLPLVDSGSILGGWAFHASIVHRLKSIGCRKFKRERRVLKYAQSFTWS
jgi:hypothetical protein